MYAVIETGGKQYRVTPGTSFEVEKLAGEIGSQLEFTTVLAVTDGEDVKFGNAVSGAKVLATIQGHGRGEKTIVFKFKRKKQYRRTQGHRQSFTRVVVDQVVA